MGFGGAVGWINGGNDGARGANKMVLIRGRSTLWKRGLHWGDGGGVAAAAAVGSGRGVPIALEESIQLGVTCLLAGAPAFSLG